jgi:transcriptional regulator with PAS, ATPase and Fis domain
VRGAVGETMSYERTDTVGEPFFDRPGRSWAEDLPHHRHVGHDAPDETIAVDPATRTLFEKADRVAAVNSTVLITGPSGTGKEVLARRIHHHSARRAGKFVPVNCGCLPESLIETEFFGYKKGAFTGALSNHHGLIQEANHGVLFLDEIGDMPLLMQVRLLRFLDSGEVRAVGDTVVRYLDVRVVAATNQDLPLAIRQKRFREDLYYRLSVVQLELPALRQRRADIPALVEHHLRRAATKLGLSTAVVSDDALALLVRYEWPGNIRELQNTIEQALVHKTGQIITPEDLPAGIRQGEGGCTRQRDTDTTLSDDRLMTTLRRHHGNHTEAAAELGISRTTLWRRLRHLKVQLVGGEPLPDDAARREAV